jgi:hypothetical protein
MGKAEESTSSTGSGHAVNVVGGGRFGSPHRIKSILSLKGWAMSMDFHVMGVRPMNDLVAKKRAAIKACVEANVPVPHELTDFFDGRSPKSILEDEKVGLTTDIPHEEGGSDGRMWMDVPVKDIPPGVEIIRFLVSN